MTIQEKSLPAEKAVSRLWRFRVISVILVFALCEAVSALGLRVIKRYMSTEYIEVNRLSEECRESVERFVRDESPYTTYSRELGWTIKPRGVSSDNRYIANAEGLRGDRSYMPRPPTGVVRVATFGDSFTHGNEVRNSETWQAVMERDGAPDIEVMNWGVSTYGTDQAYLRWQLEGASCGAQVTILGVFSENIKRVVNTYRPFYDGLPTFPVAKPRFELRGDGIVLVENPMPSLDAYQALLQRPAETIARLGEHDYFYHYRGQSTPHDGPLSYIRTVKLLRAVRRSISDDGIYDFDWSGVVPLRVYNTRSEAFEILARICERFASEVAETGSVPVIFLFPIPRDLGSTKAGRVSRYGSLRDRLTGHGIAVLDLEPGLTARASNANGADLFMARGHYSPFMNEAVAAEALRFLRERGLVPPRRP